MCHSAQAEVFFLDFGNSEVKSLAEIQPLPKQFNRPEAQAVPVQLFNVTSANPTLLAKEFESITDGIPLICVFLSCSGMNCTPVYSVITSSSS